MYCKFLKYDSSLLCPIESNSHSYDKLGRMGDTGRVDSLGGGPKAIAQPMQASFPEPSDSSTQTVGTVTTGGSLTNETVSRKALDKVIWVRHLNLKMNGACIMIPTSIGEQIWSLLIKN